MGVARAGGGEYPERVGQPVCQVLSMILVLDFEAQLLFLLGNAHVLNSKR